MKEQTRERIGRVAYLMKICREHEVSLLRVRIEDMETRRNKALQTLTSPV